MYLSDAQVETIGIHLPVKRRNMKLLGLKVVNAILILPSRTVSGVRKRKDSRDLGESLKGSTNSTGCVHCVYPYDIDYRLNSVWH